ncbi:MAG: DUF1571 domain-containing protein [Saprospiraceae bacterium]|nr:DUF1571 domain-containing protein [Saprospiraceae bacterium]
MNQAILFLMIFVLPLATQWSASPYLSADRICEETFVATKSIESLSYQMRKAERIGDEMQVQVSQIKLNRNPYCVYMKQISPKKGLEVLFTENEKDRGALVSPNGFPWITLKLDPQGSTMLKNQHHTVKDAGFDLVIGILEHLFEKYRPELQEMLTLESNIEYQGHLCHRITFTNQYFHYVDYAVGPGENMLTIGRKRNVSSYLILARNKNFDSYFDVDEGDQLSIPSDYSPKMELLIDQKRLIPLSIKVYDEHGLFEHYEYSDVEIDPPFTDNDFSKENTAYGF